MSHEEHWAEVDRLWRAVRRDLCSAIEAMSGLRDDDKAMRRLMKNWDRLCETEVFAAQRLYHGLEQICMAMRRDDVEEETQRLMNEALGMVEIGRQANPDAEVETVGELWQLGKDKVRKDIEGMTDGKETT